jgi:hypothetical protein
VADLSPAAQAVRDAYKKGGLDAALRAAADQVVPEEREPASIMGPVYVAETKQRRKLRSELLFLATELETH